MAVVLGNLALLLDMMSARTVTTDRKSRPSAIDVVLNLPKRDPHFFHASFSNKSQLEYWDGENRAHRVVARGKANSKVKAVDSDAGSSDDEGNGNGNGFEEEEKVYDWEKEMRKRVKEIEEMRELEKKAEELQSKAEAEESEGEGREETEEEKRMRVRKELEKVAKEQAERRATAQLMFELGQKAYGKGMYGRAIEFLEGALTIIPGQHYLAVRFKYGWLWPMRRITAMRTALLCTSNWKKHPSVSIRRQATELRYILQAPKLKISQEEMVTIPLIGSSYDSYAATWSDKYKDKDQRRSGSTTNQLPSSRDFLGDFLVWRPPAGLEKNQAFWVALTLWFGLVGAALFLQR